MENTKIIHFLKCLSKHEFREFGKFVRSPFHNNRKDVIRFYDILKKLHPEFSMDERAKKSIFEKLYPGRKFNSTVLVLLSSYLYNLGKEFLSILDLKEDRFFHQYFILNSLDKHHADNLFEKEYKSTAEFMKNEKLSSDFFHQKSLLEELRINYNLKRNRQDKICRETVEFSDLSVYSFIVKLVLMYHDLLVNKQSFNYEFVDSPTELFIKSFNFEGFINNLEIEKIENHNYLLYYYYLFMCNYYPGSEHYYSKLKEYSFKDFDKLNMVEISGRFNCIIDYCMFQIKSGDSKFLRETFNLYTEALEKRLYQINSKTNEIGLIFFRNIVAIGLAAKEIDYVERFIIEYANGIKGDFKEDLLELCYAMLYYEKKEYVKALECLSKVSNTFQLFKLATKHTLIKIYYETNHNDSLFSLLDTYKHYLKNEKIITDLIKSYHTNFLNYLNILVRMRSTRKLDDLPALKKEIKENMNMDFRHKLWLIEKAEELEK